MRPAGGLGGVEGRGRYTRRQVRQTSIWPPGTGSNRLVAQISQVSVSTGRAYSSHPRRTGSWSGVGVRGGGFTTWPTHPGRPRRSASGAQVSIGQGGIRDPVTVSTVVGAAGEDAWTRPLARPPAAVDPGKPQVASVP